MGLTLRGAGRRGVVPSPLSSLFLPAFVLVLVFVPVLVLVLVLVLETKRNETKRAIHVFVIE